MKPSQKQLSSDPSQALTSEQDPGSSVKLPASTRQRESPCVIRKLSGSRKRTPLNVHLIADRIDDTRSCIRTQDLFHIEDLQIPGFHRAQFYVVAGKPRLPKYAHLFAGYMEDLTVLGNNQTSGCVVILESTESRWLLSFGTGFHLIDKDTIEADFGLRTVANLVDPQGHSSLRCLDSACLTRRAAQVREQAAKLSPLDEFSIDTATDLLRALTVNPLDDRFGVRVHGNDSLKIQVKADLSELSPLLSDLLVAYRNQAYQAGPLAFIDHIRPVKNRDLVHTLDDRLLSDLIEGRHDRIQFSPPAMLDWERVSGFKYRAGLRAPLHVELQLANLLERGNPVTLTVERLKKMSVWCVDEAHEVVTTFAPWKGLHVDINHDGRQYVLFDGNWYRIDEDFVDQLERFMTTVSWHSMPLPDYDDASESQYNQRVANASNATLELLDQNFIRIPGASTPVEPCDLLRDGKVFIHVKRGTHSRTLSHLFSQGVVSADMLLNSADYRTHLKSKSQSIQGIDECGRAPDPRQYEVVYAIVGHTMRSTLELPFFSKVSLRVAAQRLMRMGFKVSLLRIDVAPERRALSRYAA